MTIPTRTPYTKLEIIDLPPGDIRPDPDNPRTHDKRHVRQLANSIEAFEFNAPILIDDSRQIVAGHGRHAAALLLVWRRCRRSALATSMPGSGRPTWSPTTASAI